MVHGNAGGHDRRTAPAWIPAAVWDDWQAVGNRAYRGRNHSAAHQDSTACGGAALPLPPPARSFRGGTASSPHGSCDLWHCCM